jgi:sortase A
MTSRFKRLERLLLTAGIALLAVYAVARLRGEALSRASLWRFQDDRIAAQGGSDAAGPTSGSAEANGAVDFRLWSTKRIEAYKQALLGKLEPPEAVLSIPRLGLEVPVFEGTDELTLNRGAGRIPGTARPGERGNIGIAAHRDGFFRSLKDIQKGDQIRLAQPGREEVYSVDSIEIVEPTELRVLEPRERASLTLVTCYPFYFVGDAPQRYIVHASITESGEAAVAGTEFTIPKGNKEKTQ